MEEHNLTQETSTTTVDRTSNSGSLSSSRPGSSLSLWSTGDIETIQLAINLEARLTVDFDIQHTADAEAQHTALRSVSVASTIINDPEHELYPDVLEEKYTFEEADISEKQSLQEAGMPEEEYSFQEADILEEKLNPQETDITEKCSHQGVDISEKNHNPQEMDTLEETHTRQEVDISESRQEKYILEEEHSLQTSEEIKTVCTQQPELGGELGKPVPAFNLTVVDSDLVTWLVILDLNSKMNR